MTNLPDIAQRLRDCAEDPMWADHAEVPKVWLWEASAEIERLRGLIDLSNTMADLVDQLRTRVAELEVWKQEASIVLAEWEAVWEAAGKPGRLGESKAHAIGARVAELETKLTEEAAAWESAARIDAVIEGKGR